MKISELIAILQGALEAHGDRNVRCTWESITPEIAGVYIAPTGKTPKGWSAFNGELLIDCDGNSYKDEFAETVIWEQP